MAKRKKQGGMTHCTALCHDCGEEWTWYKSAKQKALRHQDKTGHTIGIDVMKSHTYVLVK